MKLIFILSLFASVSLVPVKAQVLKSPILDYYKMLDQSPKPPSETRLYSFAVDLTGNGRKSILITNDLARLGPRGDYAWSVYYSLKSGNYKLVSDPSHFIDAGINGPDYIGYIDQIKRYGVVVGFRDGVDAQYLEDGVIKDQTIDQERGHADAEHFPKYFTAPFQNYHITTYMLGQLRQKYENPTSGDSIAPKSE